MVFHLNPALQANLPAGVPCIDGWGLGVGVGPILLEHPVPASGSGIHEKVYTLSCPVVRFKGGNGAKPVMYLDFVYYKCFLKIF